jgi:hypothetical protein
MSNFSYKIGQTFKATLEVKDVDEDDENYTYCLVVKELGAEVEEWFSEQELLDAFDPERKKFLLRQKKAEIEKALRDLGDG